MFVGLPICLNVVTMHNSFIQCTIVPFFTLKTMTLERICCVPHWTSQK